jgi:hypothetical protein
LFLPTSKLPIKLTIFILKQGNLVKVRIKSIYLYNLTSHIWIRILKNKNKQSPHMWLSFYQLFEV